MGLLTIIRKTKERERQLRVLVLGLDNAGKTTCVKYLNHEDVMSISPTLGFSIQTIEHKGYYVHVWDVGGQRSLRTYWRNYFERTDALVWVVDCADRERLLDCRTELHQLLQEEKLAGATLLVLANKQDIEGALSPEIIAELLSLEQMSTSRHWRVARCSGITGLGLDDAFDWLVSDVASRLFLLAD